MPVAFDTHQLISRLIQGQMPQAQAEAVSAALTEALDDVIGTLATKKDLEALGADVRKDIEALGTTLRQEITHVTSRLSWMIGVNMTLTLLILGKLLLFKA